MFITKLSDDTKNSFEISKTIRDYFRPLIQKGVCIAFSGGVDSSLLLKLVSILRQPEDPEILAVTMDTRLQPATDTLEAETLAWSLGVRHHILSIDEFTDPQITTNPPDRCYRCKKLLFSKLKELAQSLGYPHVLEGSNLGDQKVYRPGLKAIKELQILSPLTDLKFTKAQVRELAAKLDLPTASKPSTPCLATRLPYGVSFDYELLHRLETGEARLRQEGFHNVRFRYHKPILRIEVDQEDLIKLAVEAPVLVPWIKALGFEYVTLDLEGFRSGSMDEVLTRKEKENFMHK